MLVIRVEVPARAWAPDLGELRLLGGDRTAASLGRDATVLWRCAPDYDDAPVCWRLLDQLQVDSRLAFGEHRSRGRPHDVLMSAARHEVRDGVLLSTLPLRRDGWSAVRTCTAIRPAATGPTKAPSDLVRGGDGARAARPGGRGERATRRDVRGVAPAAGRGGRPAERPDARQRPAGVEPRRAGPRPLRPGRRARRERWVRPWIPLALFAKSVADAAGGLPLTAEQLTKHRKVCSWCTLTAGLLVAAVPVALPEAHAAWRTVRGR